MFAFERLRDFFVSKCGCFAPLFLKVEKVEKVDSYVLLHFFKSGFYILLY